MKKRNLSPSFRETMYYQHGYPLDGAGLVLRSQQQATSRAYPQYHVIASPPPEKVKKSFAEKLGKTFDKLSPGSSSSKSSSEKHQQQTTPHPSWVYQPFYHVPRVSPTAYNRIPPHQSSPKSSGYYYYVQHPGGHHPNGWQDRQEFCSCPDYIYGTSSRRSKTGRCKRCHCKRVAFDEVLSASSTPQNHYVSTGSVRVQRQGSNRTPLPRNLLPYRDPYDYVRRSNPAPPPPPSRPHDYYYSEDWQNYWESSEGSTFKRSESPATARQQSTGESRPPKSSINGSIPVETPTIPESKRAEDSTSLYNLVTIKNSNNNKTVQISRVQIKDEKGEGRPNINALESSSESKSDSDSSEKENKNEEEEENDDPMKTPDISKLKAVAERRLKKLQKKYSPSSAPHKARFPRKIHIDAVILEENEEDLELENLEIISSTPVIKVKSILKRPSNQDLFDEDFDEPETKKDVESPLESENELGRKVRFIENKESLLIDLSDPVEEEEEKEEQISDEFSGFDPQVISSTSTNFTDEILTEIYGETKEIVPSSPPQSSSPKESYKSLADEIMNELFGGTENSTGDSLKEATESINPAIVEFARRFTTATGSSSSRQTRRSSSPSSIKRTNSINGTGDSKENAMSQLFNDTTRIRLQKHRRRPLSLFSPEFPPRPKDPPPPPPPKSAAESEEDEFSSDEFSEDSFDEGFVKYANLSEDRLPPEGAESEVGSPDDLAETKSMDGGIEFMSPKEGKPNTSLIENNGDKTIIYTSPHVARHYAGSPRKVPNGLKDESECKIMISSSSWINVEGEKNMLAQDEEEEEEGVMTTSEEPIKPPRLKKIARQKKQGEEGRSPSRQLYSNPEHEYVNCAMLSSNKASELRRNKKAKPEISAPILVATTFNPNDAESHKTLSPRDSLQRPPFTSSSPDKITFKDIKKFARSISSFTSGLKSLESPSEDYPPSEHIYEEISDESNPAPRPLPAIPEKRDGSFFEGASKYEILRYLKNAKDRIGHSDFEIELSEINLEYESSSVTTGTSTLNTVSNNAGGGSGFIGKRNQNHRVSAISNVSDSSNSSGDSASSGSELLILRGCTSAISSGVDIERTDSGVGSETSKSSKSRISTATSVPSRVHVTSEDEEEEEELEDDYSKEADLEETQYCLDCNEKLHTEDDISTNDRLSMIVCSKCAKRRSERKETITEIIETEIKYGRDLRIIVEEFYRPMLVAGLLNSEQLSSIFLNAEELISVNERFTETLKDAIEIALDHGDEDLTTVNIGRLFLESLFMLKAFEHYCTRQGSASMLLTTLEKEKELLRIFLKVSQMENSMLRRMNLSSFLMVPVQRVTKYPLLLSRLHKVTLVNHEDRSSIKLAQEKIEESLEQMNKEAKDVNPNKIWKRLPKMSTPSPTKTVDIQAEMGNVRIRKMALDLLGWNRDEIRFPLEGKMLYTQPNEPNWKKVWTVKLTPVSALLAVWSSEELPEISPNKALIFPQESGTIKDASLLLVREKNSRFTLVRDPLPLDRCVVCCDPDWDDCFEIQEFVNKESFVFKGEEPEQTSLWFQTLQFYTQSLGGWRKRRKGLGNIMFDPNFPSSQSNPECTETGSGGGEEEETPPANPSTSESS